MRSAVAALRGHTHPAAALSSLSQLCSFTTSFAAASTAQGLRSITHSSSAHSPHTEQDVQQLQQQLLQDALKHVKQHGWTRASLEAAAADLQLSPAAVGMFPRGPSHLVEHFIAQQNALLERELQEQQQQYVALPLRQRISAAVRRRLEMNAAHMDSWPQVCVACFSNPFTVPNPHTDLCSTLLLPAWPLQYGLPLWPHCALRTSANPHNTLRPSLRPVHVQALALVSQPLNAPSALKLLTQLLDTIW